MPMRNELAIPAMRGVRPPYPAGPAWSHAIEVLKSPDFAAVAIISGLGLLLSIWLTMSLPLPVEAATFLAQVS